MCACRYVLALEQKARGQVRAIYPVFVGEVEGGTSRLSNFFATGGVPKCHATVAVMAVDEKARAHLAQRQPCSCQPARLLRVEDRTPGGVLAQILKYQGGFVEGEREEALDAVTQKIDQMVRDVSRGKVIAEAADEEPRRVIATMPSRRRSTALPPTARGRWHRRLARLFRRRGLPSEVATLRLATEREAHGAAEGKQGGVQDFLSAQSAEQDYASDGGAKHDVNPILVHKAKEAKAGERRRKTTSAAAPGGKYKSGGLARLDPSRAQGASPEAEVEEYLSKHEHVASSPKPRPSAVATDLLQRSIDQRRMTENSAQRNAERRRSQLAVARAGAFTQA